MPPPTGTVAVMIGGPYRSAAGRAATRQQWCGPMFDGFIVGLMPRCVADVRLRSLAMAHGVMTSSQGSRALGNIEDETSMTNLEDRNQADCQGALRRTNRNRSGGFTAARCSISFRRGSRGTTQSPPTGPESLSCGQSLVASGIRRLESQGHCRCPPFRFGDRRHANLVPGGSSQLAIGDCLRERGPPVRSARCRP